MFYNNDGRIIGSAYIPVREIILIPEGTPYSGIENYNIKLFNMSGNLNILEQYGRNYCVNGIGNDVSGFIVFFSKLINMPFPKLLKIRITDMDRSIHANFLFSRDSGTDDGMYYFNFSYYDSYNYSDTGYIRKTNSSIKHSSLIILKIQNNILTEIYLAGYTTNYNELCEISNNLKIELIGE